MSNKEPKLNKNIFPLFTLILSASFLSVIVCACILFGMKLKNASEQEPEVVIITEYIYIKDQDEDNSVSTGNDTVSEERFLVKEHSGQIGIFSLEEGEIRYVIERNVKTLPEADKRLLQEGFIVIGMNGIYSVIEDYTG